MNNPKLTNVLLIALVVLNCFLLLGWMAKRHHRNREICMREHRWHHHHGNWAFHRGNHGFHGNYRYGQM